MKILITGATGYIGKEALSQALLRPEVTTVVALGRRELAPDAIAAASTKLKSVVIDDFLGGWTSDVLEQIQDADAMIWAMGTSDSNRGPNLEFPAAFQDAFLAALRAQESRAGRPPFRYIHLSGKFVRQDQTKPLWFLEKPRKIKGLAETWALDLEKEHGEMWQSFVVKPSGVVPRSSALGGVLERVLGQDWLVRGDELGAFMVELAVGGGEKEDRLIQNGRIVERGRELLAAQKS